VALEHPLTIDKSTYYAPTPMLLMDARRRIVDFNIALEVLMAPDIEGCRLRPARLLLNRLGSRIEGDLLPEQPASSPVGIRDDGTPGDAVCTDNGVRTSECRYRSKAFGLADLRCTAISQLDPSTGRLAGMMTFMEITGIQEEAAFSQRLRREWDHQLTWEVYAASYDRVLPVLWFYKQVIERHVQAMSESGIRDVLDLGAGTGNVTLPLLDVGRHVTAVDLSRAMLDKLRAKLPREEADFVLEVVEQNAEHSSQWKDESFDGVTILLALYDMAEPLAAVKNAARALRPGGVLVITEPKRCFNLQALLEEGERCLQKQGLHESLGGDWERVTRANRVLDPSARTAGKRVWAEDVHAFLRNVGFTDLETKDSHLGNCATVRGRKQGGG